MTQLFRKIAAVAFVLCFARSAGAQTPNLSADETLAYINATLHKYPTLEFGESGCTGYQQSVAISNDRRSILIKENFGQSIAGTCDDMQTLTVPIFSLNREGIGDWTKTGQHSAFHLNCINRVSCFSRQSDKNTFPFASNDWYLRMTAPNQVSDQMTKAVQHLLDSLLSEATARLDNNDPFAKHSH